MDYELQLQQHLDCLKMAVIGAGIMLATNHYPRRMGDDELEALARTGAQLLRIKYQHEGATPRLTNDPRLMSTFIDGVKLGYQFQVVRCDADPAQAERDKHALTHLDEKHLQDYFDEQARSLLS